MSTSSFTIQSNYTPRNGDCVILLYSSSRKACFSQGQIPDSIRRLIQIPKDPGGSLTTFSGLLGKSRIMAKVVRVDAPHQEAGLGVKKIVSSAIAEAPREGLSRLVVILDSSHEDWIAEVQEGALLGGYRFDKYFEKKRNPIPVLSVVKTRRLAALKKIAVERAKLHSCVNFSRDILNEPPNVIKPSSLAKECIRFGKLSGLKVTIWDEKRLVKEKCGGILGVGQGSADKPRLVIGEHNPRGARKHLVLVGKGLTYDSGGYGLKPADAQIGMKYDMGGAAMMFAAACAIARLKLPIKVTVLTPLAENAISGEAYFTTSILTTRAGRTVEVMHTDAEGRLVLVDALSIAVEKKPDWIIDSATLTGACVVALGNNIAAAYGTDSTFTQKLIEAGSEEGERFWEMPLHMQYMEDLKSNVADCKNIGSRWGGSITAALFLKKWVPDRTKWIHCDIAGPGCLEGPLDHLGKGSKGFGVKTIVNLTQKLSGK